MNTTKSHHQVAALKLQSSLGTHLSSKLLSIIKRYITFQACTRHSKIPVHLTPLVDQRGGGGGLPEAGDRGVPHLPAA